MRRTFALFGVAALAIAGLAGPANASDINAQITATFAETGQDGSGVLPDTTSPNKDQAWFELKNLASTPAELVGHSVIACVDPSSTTPIEFVQEYGVDDEIAGNAIARTADLGFDGSADFRWDAAETGEMDSASFDVRLVFDLGGPNEEVVASTSRGTPNGTCVANLPS